jgi:prepilin-type N-terminal cleavage/methylation domain-containing protein
MPKNRRKGFSLIELLIVIAIILIITAIAAPQVTKFLMSGRETAAIGNIRTIHQAETQYYSQFGRYAASLLELGPPASGTAAATAADIIPKGLADGKNGGYNFAVVATQTGYAITALPEAFNTTGRRTFYSDQSLVIHNNWSAEPATAASPEIK